MVPVCTVPLSGKYTAYGWARGPARFLNRMRHTPRRYQSSFLSPFAAIKAICFHCRPCSKVGSKVLRVIYCSPSTVTDGDAIINKVTSVLFMGRNSSINAFDYDRSH